MRLAQKIAFKSQDCLDDLPLTIVTITNLSLKKALEKAVLSHDNRNDHFRYFLGVRVRLIEVST